MFKKNNKKGFTLIELLAVIVILGVVMGIAVTSYNGYIVDSKKSGFASSTQLFFKAARDSFLLNDELYQTGKTYYFNVSNAELESGGKSPYNNEKYTGYISVTTTLSATDSTPTNTYTICVTDGVNGINKTGAKADEQIDKKDLAAVTTCTIPTGAIESGK